MINNGLFTSNEERKMAEKYSKVGNVNMKNRSNPTFILELLGSKLNIKRDMQLDAIKVAARSDDQANSACSIVKKLYYYFGWLVQMEVDSYDSKNDTSAEDIDFSDKKERDHMSDVIFSIVFHISDSSIDPNEHDFLEPLSKYFYLDRWVHIIMAHVGAYSYPTLDGLDVQESVEAIENMNQEINRLISGYNPYN